MTDTPYGELREVAPGIAAVLARNPGPFTLTGTQTFLVGERELVVIDPGPDLPEHVDALVCAIDRRPVAAILITHTHRDHSPAAPALARVTGAPVIGCAPLADKISAGDESFDRNYTPDRVLADGETVQVDGRLIKAVATPGHTSNHLCFADEAACVLFTGDHVMGWSTTVVIPPDGDMGAYMASLEKLRGREDRIYYPAHGQAVTNPQQLVRSLIGHRQQRERQVLAVLGGGSRTIPEIVAEAYPSLDPRLAPAAGASVWAHLLDLQRRGLVVQTGETWSNAA